MSRPVNPAKYCQKCGREWPNTIDACVCGFDPVNKTGDGQVYADAIGSYLRAVKENS